MCKFCRRDDLTKNPLTYSHDEFIPWRRQFGQECGICPWVIANNTELSKFRKDILASKLHDDDAFFAEYMVKVTAWEDEKNASGGKRVQSNKRKHNLAPVEVEATATEALQYRKHLGNLWPIAVYEREKGSKPPKHLIQTHVVSGSKVRGVLLDDSQGKPPGIIEVSVLSETGSTKRSEVATSSSAGGQDAVDAAWATAQKRHKVNVMPHKGKDKDSQQIGAVDIKLVGASASHGGYDSEGDDVLLDDVWGPRFGTKKDVEDDADEQSGDDQATPQKGSSKRRRSSKAPADATQAGPAPVRPRKPEPAPGPQATPTTPTAAMQALQPTVPPLVPAKNASLRQINLELDKADQVLLQCKQFVSNFSNNGMVMSLTLKAFTGLKAKLDGRLLSDLLKIYTADYQGGASLSRGMQLLDELQKQSRVMCAVGAVLESVHAQEGDAASAKHLLSAVEGAKATQLAVAACVLEMIPVRGMAEAMAKGDYNQFTVLLDYHSKCDTGSFGLGFLAKERAQAGCSAACHHTLVSSNR